MADDTVFIEGRSRDTAIALLKAAGDLGHPLDVVRTTLNGYYAPADVAKAYEDGVEYTPAEKSKPAAEDEAEAPTEESPAEEQADEVEQPSKKASTEAWAAYAETKGYDPARGLTRKELIAEYGQS